jgi:cell division septum initiation protein DivIVA
MERPRDHSNDPSWAYLAPVDLREHDLPVQAALGFHRGQTDELLGRAADTIERLNRELAEFRETWSRWKEERGRLKTEVEEQKARTERLLGEAMLTAHRAGEQLLADARIEAHRLVAEAEAECERLAAQTEQYKLLAADVQHRSVAVLRDALAALDEAAVEADPSGETVTPFRRPDVESEESSSPTVDVEQPDPSPSADPMTRLWRNAGDRETGAAAVEAIRARNRTTGA